MELDRFLLTRSEVSPVHVTKCPSSITFINVERTGLNAALCRYLAYLDKVACKYVLFAKYLCVLFDSDNDFVFWLPAFRLIVHKRVVELRLPMGMRPVFISINA